VVGAGAGSTPPSQIAPERSRRTFASVAAAGGLGLPIIGKMLGHTQPATTVRYAHLASDPVKTATAVAGRIEQALSGAKVVSLRRSQPSLTAPSSRPRVASPLEVN
jgi:hypothetical protein